jgi:hypothetical protein
MAQGPDDPYSRTFVGASPPRAQPGASARPDDSHTVPVARFTPGPPSAPTGDVPNTFVAARPVAPAAPRYAPAPVGYGMPPAAAPTYPPSGSSGLPPAGPPQVAPSLTPLYGGLPTPQAPAAPPAPAGHRRALLWLAVSTTTLAIALFAVSIVLHLRRPASDRSATNQPTRMEAPRETVGSALTPAPAAPPSPVPPPAAPTAAPSAPATPPPVAAPPPTTAEAPVEAPPAHDAPTAHRSSAHRRHIRAPIRRRRRTDTPLWGVP